MGSELASRDPVLVIRRGSIKKGPKLSSKEASFTVMYDDQ